MGTIKERNGRFRVCIRKKGIVVSQTFSNRETAELWERYKEDLINEQAAFDPANDELITVQDAIQMKKQRMQAEGKGVRDINDVAFSENFISEILDKSISYLTYDFLLEKANNMLSSVIKRGGNKKNINSGRRVISSPSTVLRKFRVLSSIISNLIDKGVKIENHALKICAWLRTKIDEKEVKQDEGYS